jgi:hypothetical protein
MRKRIRDLQPKQHIIFFGGQFEELLAVMLARTTSLQLRKPSVPAIPAYSSWPGKCWIGIPFQIPIPAAREAVETFCHRLFCLLTPTDSCYAPAVRNRKDWLCKTRTSPSCSPARATCPDFQNCSFTQIFHQHRSNLADHAFFWNRVAGREALSHNSSATLKHRRYPWGKVAGGVSGVGGIGAWPPSTVRNKSIVPSGWGRAKSSP